MTENEEYEKAKVAEIVYNMARCGVFNKEVDDGDLLPESEHLGLHFMSAILILK